MQACEQALVHFIVFCFFVSIATFLEDFSWASPYASLLQVVVQALLSIG